MVLQAGGGEAQTGAAPSRSARCKAWRLVKEAAIPQNDRFGRGELLSEPPGLGTKPAATRYHGHLALIPRGVYSLARERVPGTVQ